MDWTRFMHEPEREPTQLELAACTRHSKAPHACTRHSKALHAWMPDTVVIFLPFVSRNLSCSRRLAGIQTNLVSYLFKLASICRTTMACRHGQHMHPHIQGCGKWTPITIAVRIGSWDVQSKMVQGLLAEHSYLQQQNCRSANCGLASILQNLQHT